MFLFSIVSVSNLNIFVSSVNTSIVSRVVNCSVSNISSVSVSIVREIKKIYIPIK